MDRSIMRDSDAVSEFRSLYPFCAFCAFLRPFWQGTRINSQTFADDLVTYLSARLGALGQRTRQLEQRWLPFDFYHDLSTHVDV